MVWFVDYRRYDDVYLCKSIVTHSAEDNYRVRGVAGTIHGYRLFPTKRALIKSFAIIDDTKEN